MTDDLGDRMKAHYENRVRYVLPRRTYTIVRVDGKAFHSYTRHFERPFSTLLAEAMDSTAMAMCKAMQGAQLAYVQSDEISVLLTDFEKPDTEAWFDGNVQKIVSVAASIATATFNQARTDHYMRNASECARQDVMRGCSGGKDYAERYVEMLHVLSEPPGIAMFDGRAFTIPDPTEVENYFIWRQQDATRNSISMAAQAHFSHQQLHGKSTGDMQELLWSERGVNWNDYPDGFKRGRVVIQGTTTADIVYTDKRTGQERLAAGVERSIWEIVAPPVFTRERAWLSDRIPRLT